MFANPKTLKNSMNQGGSGIWDMVNKSHKIALFHLVLVLAMNRKTLSSHWHIKLGYNDGFKLKDHSSVHSDTVIQQGSYSYKHLVTEFTERVPIADAYFWWLVLKTSLKKCSTLYVSDLFHAAKVQGLVPRFILNSWNPNSNGLVVMSNNVPEINLNIEEKQTKTTSQTKNKSEE
ncbi:hypothetical protein HPG69_007078 [Diceros bicornis minor]|uniref:Uncharacterized protein n=1 Tax=Diceros bicornis minor TaxID=77932 RepID=A0A7J7F2C5_DICBM|nr:hypothetical protein HPG69_007078 [Diceros bicornis minor]